VCRDRKAAGLLHQRARLGVRARSGGWISASTGRCRNRQCARVARDLSAGGRKRAANRQSGGIPRDLSAGGRNRAANRQCASVSRGLSDSSGRPWGGCCRPWAVTAPSPLLFLLEARPCAAGTVATRGSADLAAERDRARPSGGTRPSETGWRNAAERDRAAERGRARPSGETRPSETERRNETWTAPMRRFRLDAGSAKGVIWLYVCTRALRVLCEPPFEERVIWPSASCHSLRMWRS
jgi:hypothetical protein